MALNYPKDNEFYSRFKETKSYGGGDRQIKTKLILETLEESFAHKETVPFDNLTIEHVMPQTLSEWWQNHLGDDWEETHELFLHTIGNLTLSAYNTELSNDDFTTKKQTYNESHLDLNKYFSPISSWTRSEIEKRAEILSKQSLEIWSYFGQEQTASSDLKEVTGTTPRELKILGQKGDAHLSDCAAAHLLRGVERCASPLTGDPLARMRPPCRGKTSSNR